MFPIRRKPLRAGSADSHLTNGKKKDPPHLSGRRTHHRVVLKGRSIFLSYFQIRRHPVKAIPPLPSSASFSRQMRKAGTKRPLIEMRHSVHPCGFYPGTHLPPSAVSADVSSFPLPARYAMPRRLRQSSITYYTLRSTLEKAFY
jgi:hypothetical protein